MLTVEKESIRLTSFASYPLPAEKATPSITFAISTFQTENNILQVGVGVTHSDIFYLP